MSNEEMAWGTITRNHEGMVKSMITSKFSLAIQAEAREGIQEAKWVGIKKNSHEMK